MKNLKFKTAHDVLIFWQECHGELSDRWKNLFISDPKVAQILRFGINESIMVAIKRNRKLSDILEDLHLQDQKTSDFKNAQNPFTNSIPDGMGEKPQTFGYWYKWGGSWRKQF